MRFINNIKIKISEEIEGNIERIKHHEQVLRSRGDSSDTIDVTQDEANKAESRRVLKNLDVRNKELKKAQFRIKNDTYLDCKSCGDEIAEARLEATLIAEQCSYCANKEFKINQIINPVHIRGQSQQF